MKLLVYVVYLALVIMGAYYIFKTLTNFEERKIYRTKILKQINDKKEAFVKKNKESVFQKKLQSTGIRYLSATRYQIIRISFILTMTAYYGVVPNLNSEVYDLTYLAIPPLLIILSEPNFKYSVTTLAVNMLIKRKNKKKIVELFTLFDMLKAELNTLKANQEVNIYNILRGYLPMFEHITGTLTKFLSLWRTSPEEAKNVFSTDIGEESASVLGDILYKLDNTAKNEALKIIEAESNVFSFTYYESQMHSSVKVKNIFFIMFSVNIVLILAWLITFIYTMFSDALI
jgi:hypothetical protein